MRRPPARLARRVTAAVLTAAGLAACADDGAGAGTGERAPVTVVAVAALACDRQLPSEGAGVLVGDGLVVTAAHVVDGPRRAVTVAGAPATVVAVDARTDLAVLRADDGEGTELGEPAALTDDPSGPLQVVTPAGRVDVELVRTGRLIVHDVSAGARHERLVHTVSPDVPAGTSGSALVAGDDRLAGIVVLANRNDRTTYAVTAGELRELLAGAVPDASAACPD